MSTRSIRGVGLGLAVLVCAALLVVTPAVFKRQQAAEAEQIRARCVRELSAKRSWRAEITETETGSDGMTSVIRQQLVVRKPGVYRLTLRERDAKGREVVSTTIRTVDAVYTRRVDADGSTELHVLRGARPSLGVELDNLLGQTVQAVADAKPLRVVDRGTHAGVSADKLELGPGHFVWVAQSTGMPIEEQVVAGDAVAHSVLVTAFDDKQPVSSREFDPDSLGQADATIVEDSGFRRVDSAQLAATEIGFMPFEIPAPAGFSADVRGYVDPSVPNGDAPAEGAFVCAFSSGADGVIVTQVSRPGAGDSFVPATVDDGSFERVDVAGKPAAYFGDGSHPRLVFARRDVLVTIEGNLTESAMRELAERIR